MADLRVLLVDDHAPLRALLRRLLEQQGWVIVAEADNGVEAIALAQAHRPDVVVMDVTMPGGSGIDATRLMRQQCPDTRIVALSMHSDRRYVAQMLAAGASAYVLKSNVSSELVRAIEAVRGGGQFLCPSAAGVVIDMAVGPQSLATPVPEESLTPREQDVLRGIAAGLRAKEIADRLQLSVRTVEAYRMQIGRKLRLESVAELTKYALRHGLAALEQAQNSEPLRTDSGEDNP